MMGEGQKESWIIKMDCKATKNKIDDYDLRQRIENLFSDFKSIGFEI